MGFPRWLRGQMERREWSVTRLARELGINHGTVSQWLSGDRHPSPASCKRIADVLFVDLDEVLTIAGHRDPDLDVDPNAPGEQIAALARRIAWSEDRYEAVRDMFTGWLERDRKRREGKP